MNKFKEIMLRILIFLFQFAKNELFKFLDKNNDGYITKEEWDEILEVPFTKIKLKK